MLLFHRTDVKHLRKFEKVKVSCCKSRCFHLLNKRFVLVVLPIIVTAIGVTGCLFKFI